MRQVWREDGSPLAAITARAGGGAGRARSAPDVIVDWAMRYGSPAIAERLAALKAAGCERILLAPLYPQYCARDDGDRQRQGVRRAGGDALAAGDAHAAALS